MSKGVGSARFTGRSLTTGALSLLVALFVTLPPGLFADDEGHGGGHHHHHVAVAGGGAFKGETPKSAFFLGVDYEYRINATLGLGGYYEETLGDFDLQAFGVLFFVHPTDGLKLAAGAAVERKFGEQKNKALIRLQVAYDFQAGDVSFGPVPAWDLIEDQSNVVYVGFGVGFGF